MKKFIVFTVIFVLVAIIPVLARIINVPGDYPTIQGGIDASSDGDTVLVDEGIYVENINFNGHNIVLGSLFLTTEDTSYISTTIIDGDSSGSVVTFENGEDSTAVITGFTIQNGFTYRGGGVHCNLSAPTICHNNIMENSATDYGGGICCWGSNPIIINNKIYGNETLYWDYGSGGGIYCRQSSSLIANNIISNNYSYG